MPVVSNKTSILNAGQAAFIRAVLRLIASGALTAAVDQIAGGLNAAQAAFVLSVWAAVLSYAQVHVENVTGKKILVTPPTNSASATATATATASEGE